MTTGHDSACVLAGLRPVRSNLRCLMMKLLLAMSSPSSGSRMPMAGQLLRHLLPQLQAGAVVGAGGRVALQQCQSSQPPETVGKVNIL